MLTGSRLHTHWLHSSHLPLPEHTICVLSSRIWVLIKRNNNTIVWTMLLHVPGIWPRVGIHAGYPVLVWTAGGLQNMCLEVHSLTMYLCVCVIMYYDSTYGHCWGSLSHWHVGPDLEKEKARHCYCGLLCWVKYRILYCSVFESNTVCGKSHKKKTTWINT